MSTCTPFLGAVRTMYRKGKDVAKDSIPPHKPPYSMFHLVCLSYFYLTAPLLSPNCISNSSAYPSFRKRKKSPKNFFVSFLSLFFLAKVLQTELCTSCTTGILFKLVGLFQGHLIKIMRMIFIGCIDE